MIKSGVITGDLIDSSSQMRQELERIQLRVTEVVNENNPLKEYKHFGFFQGDSFQWLITDVASSLNKALQIMASLNFFDPERDTCFDPEGKQPGYGVRISIGIGYLPEIPKLINRAVGEPFSLSGRAMSGMKKSGQKIIISSENGWINKEFEVECGLLDHIIDKWSAPQAEVIYYALKGLNQERIAKKLSISQSAVNQRINDAGWAPLKKMLQRFEALVDTI